MHCILLLRVGTLEAMAMASPKFRKPSRVKALRDSCITSLACPTPPDSLPNKLPRLAFYHGVWRQCSRQIPPWGKRIFARFILNRIPAKLHISSEKCGERSGVARSRPRDVLEPRGGSTDTAGYPRQYSCPSQVALSLQATLEVFGGLM